jgi:hypothetical protein
MTAKNKIITLKFYKNNIKAIWKLKWNKLNIIIKTFLMKLTLEEPPEIKKMKQKIL